MKNLPLNDKYFLYRNPHPGVFELDGTDMYVKIASKIKQSPVKVRRFIFNRKKKLENVLTCAKAYEVLKKEGVYSPDTQAVVCKDDKNYLTLMIVTPKLSPYEFGGFRDYHDMDGYCEMNRKLAKLEEKYSLKSNTLWDLKFDCNQGWNKSRKYYVHDIHIAKSFNPFNIIRFRKMLKTCRRIVENE